MSLHPDAKHLHIGCDEVFHMGECDACKVDGVSRSDLFVNHVQKVAKHVKDTYKVDVIIWDDMLRNFMADEMEPLADLVQPMVWVYADDVYRFFPPYNWDKLAKVFDSVWTAGAFKGAHGPTLTVPPITKHLANALNWLDVMKQESAKFRKGMYGMVTTGWQRYDHFAVLAEILPVAIPSLAVNLIAMEHGYFNSSLKNVFYDSLDCTTQSNLASADNFKTFINLETDPYLWRKLQWCFFPGNRVFQLTSQIEDLNEQVETYLEKAQKKEGWLTDFNIRRNYSSPFRVNELTEDLKSHLHTVVYTMKNAKQVLEEFFDDYTVAEWIEQKIYPLYQKLSDLWDKGEELKKRRHWTRRPFPVDNVLSDVLGIPASSVQMTSSSSRGGRALKQPAAPQANVQQYSQQSVMSQSNLVESPMSSYSQEDSTVRPRRLVQQPDYYRNPPSVIIGA